MRLGYADKSRAFDCALAIESAGATHLTVHARTKVEGYKPPAHWDWIARIRDHVHLPVIANGEVWTVADWHAIRVASGCDTVMIGRGMVASPGLAGAIKAGAEALPAWPALLPWLSDFFAQCHAEAGNYAVARIKQWLGQLKRTYPEAQELFAELRAERQAEAVAQILSRLCPRAA